MTFVDRFMINSKNYCYVGISSPEPINTFFEPDFKCLLASSRLVKIPVHSTTKSIFNSSQLIFFGSGSLINEIELFPIFTLSESLVIFCSKVPCTESYLNK